MQRHGLTIGKMLTMFMKIKAVKIMDYKKLMELDRDIAELDYLAKKDIYVCTAEEIAQSINDFALDDNVTPQQWFENHVSDLSNNIVFENGKAVAKNNNVLMLWHDIKKFNIDNGNDKALIYLLDNNLSLLNFFDNVAVAKVMMNDIYEKYFN